jgi:predicted transcriptional regulator
MNESRTKRNSLYGFEMREPDLRRTSGKNSYEIKQLWQRSHEIIGLALQGHSQKDIATILKITPLTVSSTLNSELGMKKLSKMREERDGDIIKVSERITELQKRAFAVYTEIFDNKDEEGTLGAGSISMKLRKETADTLTMDLGGHRSPTKIEAKTLNVTATTEEIEEFKARGIAAAKEAGMIIDLNKPRKLLDPVQPDCSNPEQSEMEGQL